MSSGTLRRLALAGLAVLTAGLLLSSTVAAHKADRHGKGGHHNHHLLKANLDGAQEVPGPGDPDGRGKALVKVKPHKGKVCFELRWRKIGDPTMAHIHAGKKGVAGPIVVLFFEGTPVRKGCVEGLDQSLLRAIRDRPRDYYVNIHNAEFPAGAIRGQLKHTGKHRGHKRHDRGDDRKHDDNGKHHGDDDRGDHRDDDDHGKQHEHNERHDEQHEHDEQHQRSEQHDAY
jgi:hypothetical protein